MLAFHCLLSSCWPQALAHVIKRLLVAFYSKGMLIMMMAEVERGWGWGVGAKAEFALRPCGMGKGCYVLMTLTFELLRLLDTAAAGWLHTRPGVSLKYALSDRGVAATLPSKSLLSQWKPLWALGEWLTQIVQGLLARASIWYGTTRLCGQLTDRALLLLGPPRSSTEDPRMGYSSQSYRHCHYHHHHHVLLLLSSVTISPSLSSLVKYVPTPQRKYLHKAYSLSIACISV